MTQTATIAGVPIVKVGHGLMSMTWVPEPPSDEQCFESIIAGINAAPAGVKVFLNAGEFYGTWPNVTANLELLNRFFTKYPEYAERTFLSVKGAIVVSERGLDRDSSPAGLQRSINNIIEKLGPNKNIDLFEPARVSIEETMSELNKYVESGKIGAIGLSECSAATLERASKFGKVAAVEIEVSLWSYEEETRKVISKAAEIGAIIAAYGPLGQGVLTGKLNPAELCKDDQRSHLPRFQEEAFRNNAKLVDALKVLADKKKITSAQLCLAWVSSLGPHVVPIPSSTRAARTLENVSAASIKLSKQDLEEITHTVEANPISGDRYPETAMKYVWG
ncbi:pyridoxine 4-dehydrogenase [Rhizoctonia solani AG-1 IB]|uniref:Pyridoxine 4-dehydrogenase n=1 Tax=Thanatephorus cucumeris (strain AG1-IB / isolate 7/3/14) TaxID=1108050 RepID=M5CDN4_THACB|nr:pyridoxine 4-dehydrogenase [Rhizoctonia solani AG-1 IB]